MDLEMNFLGICAVDWQASYRFYTEVLGMHVELAPHLGVWASLGGGWDAYRAGSRSMIVELFDGARPNSARREWGHGQGIRPSIQVDDLDMVVSAARKRGVPFTGEVEAMDWGQRIEFEAPEGIRWTLSHVPERPANSDISKPYVGHVEIKAYDLAAQMAFYRDILGMSLEQASQVEIILGQGPDKPWLVIEPGGEPPTNELPWTLHPSRGQPVLLSFMTADIQAVAARLRDAQATILTEITHHAAWNGIDMTIEDVDRNVLQIVQYGNLLDT